MMTDGGKDPQSNQNSDAPFQTGAQDNEAPPGTPALFEKIEEYAVRSHRASSGDWERV